MFRVVPDQLRISDGWVRCGQCDEVFDANAHLQTLDEATLQPVSPQGEEPVAVVPPGDEPAESIAEAAPDRAYDWGNIVTGSSPAGHSAPDAAAVADSPADASEVLATSSVRAETEDQVYQPEVDPFLAQSPSDLPAAEDVLATQFDAVAPPQSDAWADHPALNEAAAPPQPAEDVPLSFMPRTRKATLLNRLWTGPVWWVLGAIGVCVLVGQIAWAERNRLGVMFPALQPALQAMCDVGDCKLSAPQQIDALAIDSSAFTNVRPGVYTLSVTLKNTAALALETPALELTLTDMQDKPLLRRVLLASEYANKHGAISAGEEFTASLPVSVQAPAAIGKVSGYKLLAFYP